MKRSPATNRPGLAAPGPLAALVTALVLLTGAGEAAGQFQPTRLPPAETYVAYRSDPAWDRGTPDAPYATYAHAPDLAEGPATPVQYEAWPPEVYADEYGEAVIASSAAISAGPPAYVDSAASGVHAASPVYVDPAASHASCQQCCEARCLQLLPDGLIYRSYLAGMKEPRIAGMWVYEHEAGWIWDIALGGRVGLLRYGTCDPLRPEGWQLDLEGAAFPRLDLEHERDMIVTDFRAGAPLTYGKGPFQAKFAFYHLSSHLGDEYALRFPDLERINYSRDVLVLGGSYYPWDDLRLYAEAGWAFRSDGGSEPWELQFGIDYSPAAPSDLWGNPFAAVNGHLREELDFGGNMTLQLGWQWRGPSGHLMRAGMQYFVGMSEQFEFFDRYEDKIGMGLWYDY